MILFQFSVPMRLTGLNLNPLRVARENVEMACNGVVHVARMPLGEAA
jgi:hypothetical protein